MRGSGGSSAISGDYTRHSGAHSTFSGGNPTLSGGNNPFTGERVINIKTCTVKEVPNPQTNPQSHKYPIKNNSIS